jgi:hypothetical protein
LPKVVWKITPLFAEWLSSPSNPLFAHGLLSPSSFVLELGCGISGLVALLLAPRISHYVLTDQLYVAKLLEQNIAENHHPPTSASAKTARPSKSRPAPARREAAAGIHFTPLDWETDQATPALTGSAEAKSFDAVVACDCIYNEALVEPFVSTCVDLCRLRADEIAQGTADEPCVCVIAQQLRDPLVFEAWLARFNQSFHAWRVPDGLLGEGLRANSGFVVHVGMLRDEVGLEDL